MVAQTATMTTPAKSNRVQITRTQNGYIVDINPPYENGYKCIQDLHVFETFAGMMAFLKKEISLG